MNQMNSIKILAIVGRTGSGKDFITNWLRDFVSYATPVISFTTRKKKNWETDGVEHFFISNQEADDRLAHDHILAKTQIGEFRYFSTLETLQENMLNLYIIDPNGITGKDSLLDSIAKYHDECCIHLRVIYVQCPTIIRFWRGIVKRHDNPITFWKRNRAEKKMFDEFEKSGKINYIINSFGNTDDKMLEMALKTCYGDWKED